MSHNFGVIAICSSTGPIYPRDLLPFETAPKNGLGLSSRSDVLSRFLHGQVLRFKVPPSCSLKNEFAPGTKGGVGEVGEAKGKTTLEKRTIVLFYLNACMRRTR